MRLATKILTLGIIAVVVLLFLVDGGVVYAQSDTAVSSDWIRDADALLKTLYLFMRPLMAIAGAALDNSLVYGEQFYLNIALFKFWQLMRTFANFTIGFVFLVTIFSAYFNPNSATEKIKNVIIKSFIAVVAVWSSRFVVAALVDLSTIGVTTLGALPLQIMGDAEKIQDVRFVMTHSYYDKSTTTQSGRDKYPFDTIYSCEANEGGRQYFLDCHMQDYTSIDFGGDSTGSGNITGFVPKKGIFNSPLLGPLQYLYSQEKDVQQALARRGSTDGSSSSIALTADNLNTDYCVQQGVLMRYSEADVGIQPAKCEAWMDSKSAGIVAMSEEFNCSRFSDLTSLAANTSGPLFTLYGSIFAVSNLPATTNVGNTGEVAIEMIMKVLVGAGLIIPLLAFAVVMVIRVVVLWLVIAFSPLLALAYVYDIKQITELGDGKFGLKNILSLLMMPVIGVFAISISIIFLSVLNNVDYIQNSSGVEPSHRGGQCHGDQFTQFADGSVRQVEVPDRLPENTTHCYEFLGVQTLCINESLRTLGGNATNTLVWLITNGLGIALMRMAVMGVLKTNKFTEGAVDFIDSTAKAALKSAKIIPVPGVEGGMSIGGAAKGLSTLKTQLPQKMIQNAYDDGMSDFVDRMDGDDQGKKGNALKTAKQGAASELGNGSVIKNNKAASGHTMDTYGPGFVSNASQSIAKDIQADLNKNGKDSKYYGVDTTALSTLAAGGVSSYAQLAKNKAFIKHATENKYLSSFAKDWHNTKNIRPKQQAGVEFMKGLESISSVSKSYVDNGVRYSYYFHDGEVTIVKSDAANSLIDSVESKPFILNANNELPGSGMPSDETNLDNFMKFFESQGYNPDKMGSIFGENPGDDYPYKDLVESLLDEAEKTTEKTLKRTLGNKEVVFEVKLGTESEGSRAIEKMKVTTASDKGDESGQSDSDSSEGGSNEGE